MNYGKKKAAKRQKQITSKSAMQAKRVGVRLFKALLLWHHRGCNRRCCRWRTICEKDY